MTHLVPRTLDTCQSRHHGVRLNAEQKRTQANVRESRESAQRVGDGAADGVGVQDERLQVAEHTQGLRQCARQPVCTEFEPSARIKSDTATGMP